MLDKKKKEKIIAKYKTHDSDTGSSQVQIAILTEEIKELTKHLKDHKKDFSSRRGLLKKVAERRRLLNYLKRDDQNAYEALVKDLKIKTPKIVEETKEQDLADDLEGDIATEEETEESEVKSEE
jgi:small subunit ribosomal protein S15